MDTILTYRVIEAVKASLAEAGERGFEPALAGSHYQWFDLDWLFDHLAEVEHRRLPLLWDGRALACHDTLRVSRHGAGPPRIYREDRTGVVVVREDAAVGVLDVTGHDAWPRTFLVVGERRAGALGRFVQEYEAYARERSHREPTLHVVGGDWFPRPRGSSWDDLLVPPALHRELRAQVDGFFAAREAYQRLGIPFRRGLLLAGPPGNGKTTFLRVVASQRPEPLVLLARQEEPERSLLDEAFDLAIGSAPSILCIEDVDSLFGEGQVALSHFLNRLDGLSCAEGLLVVATTNHPEKLDAALTDRPSRFDRVILFGNPEAEQRHAYLVARFEDAYDERLVGWTDGFSMAQLKEVWVSACLEAIERGEPRPALEAARRAVERLRGQRSAMARDWQGTESVGFGAARP